MNNAKAEENYFTATERGFSPEKAEYLSPMSAPKSL